MSQLSSLTRSSIPSPLTTQLPTLSPSQIASLPYPPDLYPGARDVKNSYGTMRVYEWGNEEGRKVMMVHGDATSAPVWKRVAAGLVAKGCRVIVIDLWGRGYTETPLAPHDGRLLALQLLFAASSSPLPWCTETFSIVGFSLGGGITMDFAATFPHLVRSVALLAPAGLIRKLPDVYVDFRQAARDGKSDAELNDMLAGVLGVGEDEDSQDDVVANAAALVRWQYENHQGHATSFVSTLLNGPVQGQHEIWREACKVMSEKQLARKGKGKERLVAVCGKSDTVVRPEHVREDLDGLMGPENYVYQAVEGGHGFLLDQVACEQVVQTLVKEWEL